MEKERRRLAFALALFSVLSVAGILIADSVAEADAEPVSYGSATLPYGGVTVPWDALEDGAYYYVIEKGAVSIDFQGHDGKGLEVMLAGSGLIVNFRTSEVYGVLEKTTEMTIGGKTITLVMVPGVGYDLPIYGATETNYTWEPPVMDAYVGESFSKSYSKKMAGSFMPNYLNVNNGLPDGLSYENSNNNTDHTITGTPTSAGEYNFNFHYNYGRYGTVNLSGTINVYYRIIFNANGGSCNTTSERSMGEDITLPAATRTDHNFLGWYTQPSGGTYVGTTNDPYTPQKTVTLYAKWQQKDEPVTSISITGSSSVKVGDTMVLTAVSSPASASNRWVNWTISSGDSHISMTGLTDTTSGGTVTIKGLSVGTAVVKATARDGSGVTKTFTVTVKTDVVYNSFTLQYYANGGSGAPTSFSDSSTDSYYDTTVSTVKPSKSGYDFLGWSTSSSDTSADYKPGDTIRLYPGTTKLYAVWKAQTDYWYLYYDAGEGSGAPAAQKKLVTSGAASATFTISSTKPVREGYEFLGWTKTSGSSTASFQPGGSITIYSTPTTLYAVWKETVTEYEFNLEFDLDGGTDGPGDIHFKSEKRSYETEIPEGAPKKAGFDFRGWGESAGTDTVRYFAGDKITLSPGTKTLYAVWKQVSYVLILNVNGGNGENRTLTGYGSSGGYTFTIPSDFIPTKDGYTFAGWSTSYNGDVEYSPGGKFTCDSATLYAVWTKNVAKITYTLIYNANGGKDAPEKQTVTVDEGKEASVTLSTKEPVRDGYDFLGWSDRSDSSQPLYSKGEANVVLKSTTTELFAVWSMRSVTYMLTYNGNASDATNVPEPVTKQGYETCKFIVSAQKPVRDGYLFVGWSKDPKASDIAEYTGGSTIETSERNLIIYAVWAVDKKIWTLNFDVGEGSGGPSPMYEEAPGTSHIFTIPDDEPVWEDHVFLGWSTSKGATQASIEAGGQYKTNSTPTTLYAVWKEAPKDSFTLAFNLMGGTDGPSAIGPFYGRGEYKTTVPAGIPRSDDGLFQGWATEPNGKVAYQPGSLIILKPGTTTLYAKWSNEPVVKYTLTFDANGGQGEPSPQNGESRGTYTFTIPADIPIREGYVFAGWSTEKNGDAEYQPGDEYVATIQDTILHAVWQGDTEYRLSFKIMGGQSGPSDIVEKGEPGGHTFKLPEGCVAVRSGYEFKGWAVNDSDPAEYHPGSEYKVEKAGTYYLYAVWERLHVEVEFRLVFDANGGEGGPVLDPVKTFEDSVSFKIPSGKPKRDGYRFMGWADSKDAKGPSYDIGANIVVSEENSVNGTRTLYAFWVKADANVFTLILDPNGGKDAPTVEPQTSSEDSVNFLLPEGKPVREGYTFVGWTESLVKPVLHQPGEIVTVYYGDDGKYTLYAYWEKEGTLKAVPEVDVKGKTISYDASESGGYAKVLWTFGDGTSSWDLKGEHTYSEPGTYVVKLTVYSANDRVHSDTVSVTIEESEESSDMSGIIKAIAAIAVIAIVLILAARLLGLF